VIRLSKRCWPKNIHAEKLHLDLYEKQFELVQDNTPLRLMFEQVITDEAQHIRGAGDVSASQRHS
jgi:rubrerythrin